MRIVIVVVIVVVVVVVVLLVLLLIVVVVVVVVVVIVVVVVVVVIVRRIRNRDAWSFERSGVHEIERKEEREREREREREHTKKKRENRVLIIGTYDDVRQHATFVHVFSWARARRSRRDDERSRQHERGSARSPNAAERSATHRHSRWTFGTLREGATCEMERRSDRVRSPRWLPVARVPTIPLAYISARVDAIVRRRYRQASA